MEDEALKVTVWFTNEVVGENAKLAFGYEWTGTTAPALPLRPSLSVTVSVTV
jgi:hypothetical protein